MTAEFLEIGLTALPSAPQCGEPLDLSFTVTNPGVNYITAKELTFTLQKGNLPVDLATGFSGVEVIAPKGWRLEQTGGTFSATPEPPNNGKIGPTGLDFQILNITVNDQPGLTTVKIVQTLAPDGAQKTDKPQLNKILPPLNLHDVYADPLPVDYAQSSTVWWTATDGAVITLDVNGTVVDHVKNDPSQPLPSAGSYRIDDITAVTTVTVTARSGTGADTSAEQQKQITIPIAPPKATLSATVKADEGKVPSARLDWNTSSAATATLTGTPIGLDKSVSVGAGNLSVPFLVESAFTVSAANPVSPAPGVAKAKVDAPAFGWLNVGPGPFTAPENGTLLGSPSGLILISASGVDKPAKVWRSFDGINWSPIDELSGLVGSLPPYATVWEDTVFLSVSGPNLQRSILSSKDLVNWSKLPIVPSAPKGLACPVTFDGTGVAWAIVPIGAENTIWKSTDQMQSWTSLTTTGLPLRLATCLIELGGKLWSIGGATIGPLTADIYSSEDGQTWTQGTVPASVTGGLSQNATVFDDKICTFNTPQLNQDTNSTQPTLPMALWRIDGDGNWEQDTPTAGQEINVMNGQAVSVASFGGTLFTCGTDYFQPTGGIWARTT